MNKSIFLSKTFWLNALALASLMFPAVRDWLKDNPETATAVLGAANILLRFVTSGKVSLTDDDSPTGGTGVLLVFCGLLVGTASMGTLASCSAAQLEAMRQTPIRATVITEQGRLSYSAKGGLEVEVDQTSGR